MAKETAPGHTRPLSKSEKAAILLLCMDEQTTARICGDLRDEEIRKIGSALLKLNQIPAMQVQLVMDEFTRDMTNGRVTAASAPPAGEEMIPIEGRKLVEKFLGKTLGRGRGSQIFASLQSPMLGSGGQKMALDKLVAQCDEKSLYALISAEHPQLVALTLSMARRPVAKAVLEKFPPEQQIDLLRRMGKLEKVTDQQASALAGYLTERLTERMEQAASGTGPAAAEEEAEAVPDLEVAGLAGTVKLLKGMGPEQSDAVLAELEKVDAELTAKIRKLMFTMEDLERADAPGIRELMRLISNDDMKIALKNAGDTLKEKFFKNMSERASMILREDMDVMAPIKVEELEAAQDRILESAKNLMKEDKLKLAVVTDDEGGA